MFCIENRCIGTLFYEGYYSFFFYPRQNMSKAILSRMSTPYNINANVEYFVCYLSGILRFTLLIISRTVYTLPII